jgi:hypothetical protein
VFAKIAVLIVSIGMVACALLGIRQGRILAAAETAQVQRRVAEHDRTLWRLRIEIASRVTPEQVESKALAIGALRPLNSERLVELARAEARAADAAVTANTEQPSR